MKRKWIILAAAALIIILIATLWGMQDSEAEEIWVAAEAGPFVVKVVTTGELRSENSEKILAPEGITNRKLAINDIKITDLVPEGTVLDSGDYVATLDRAKLMDNLKNFETELQKTQSQLIQTKLDTAMTLKQARNQVIDQTYALEEAQIRFDQSKYESPATQRQAKIDMEKARRNLKQTRDNYLLKKEQAKAQMQDVEITFGQQQQRISELKELMEAFTVTAPKPGMVIYHREWNGEKRQVGSNISRWNLTIATLPDLSSMISETYVNEIDISKVNTGQQVIVTVDAFPDKAYTGQVVSIANVGEKKEGSNTKVFHVEVKLNKTDSILRPGMTTGNEIITARFDSTVYVPLEAIRQDEDGTYLYPKAGRSYQKKYVATGASNASHIIIKEGIKPGRQVLLSDPE